MKYTKKQIADEYNCMISVNGQYPDGNAKIKDALIKAEEEIDRLSVSCQINNRRREIINEAYDILTTSQAAALGSIRTPKKAAASRENGKNGGRPKTRINKQIDFTSYEAAEKYAKENHITKSQNKMRIVEQSPDVYFLEYEV